MSFAIVILRPEPGAEATAKRARARGLSPVKAPLFAVGPLAWEPPDPAGFEAVILTSANAARHGGPGLAAFLSLPCYAVGEATAAAALEAGFADLRTGASDAAALAAMLEADGVRRAFHPCGRDHLALESPAEVERRVVYAAEPLAGLAAEAAEALERGAPALLHSPRAALRFAELAQEHALDRSSIALAAISAAAAASAGPGWQRVEIASEPRDEALLEVAAKLCQTAGRSERKG